MDLDDLDVDLARNWNCVSEGVVFVFADADCRSPGGGMDVEDCAAMF